MNHFNDRSDRLNKWNSKSNQIDFHPAFHSVRRNMKQTYRTEKEGGFVMSFSIKQTSRTSRPYFQRARLPRYLRAFGIVGLALSVSIAWAGVATAGVGCDVNIRINNMTSNAVMVYGSSKSSASLAGKKLWSPLRGLVDTVLDPKNAGENAHYKRAVELQLPCWNGKRDFRFTYLDRSTPKLKQRNGVELKSGQTVQINIP